jgi:hypothetical protein
VQIRLFSYRLRERIARNRAAQQNVAKHDIGPEFLKQNEGARSIGSRFDLVAKLADQDLQNGSRVATVIDNQYAPRRRFVVRSVCCQ